MGWFKKFGDSDWWVGPNSIFGTGLQSVGDSGVDLSFLGYGISGTGNEKSAIGVQHQIDPMVIYGVGGLVLLKMLKVI